MLITDDKILAEKAKHLTTTSKIKHKWVFEHDENPFAIIVCQILMLLFLHKYKCCQKVISEKKLYFGEIF